MPRIILVSFLLLITCYLSPKTAFAVLDPLSVPNNKFGIHIITDSTDEASPAASLVNSTGGDWGYVTILITSKDRDTNRWQKFFDELRRRHLIPLVRLATKPQGAVWERPYEGEEKAWADFLDSLNWPTKNRYVIVYNEPNHASEWGGAVDAAGYAQTLDKVINSLRAKSSDFFIINAGFDASTPQQIPNYQDEVSYLQEMNKAVPGIFDKLDGWSSHSYPNPGMVGSPDGVGRGTVRTWAWEAQVLKSLGVSKNLPVFITETGWKHAEGNNYNGSYPSEHQLTDYYTKAFDTAWNDKKIVAVTPFLLNYQDPPFDHFSFKRLRNAPNGSNEDARYYPFYDGVQEIPKAKGLPKQDRKALLVKGEIYNTMVGGEEYLIPLTFKNIGQSIWGERGQVKLILLAGGNNLGLQSVEMPPGTLVEPGCEYTFNLKVKAPQSGIFRIELNLFEGSQRLDNNSSIFTTEIKSPVILKIKSALKWKENFAGEYLLTVAGIVNYSYGSLILDPQGLLPESIEAHQLPPDYAYDFTLSRPFYKPKTIHKTVSSGENTLDFGELQPDFLSTILNPSELWQLLPFSN